MTTIFVDGDACPVVNEIIDLTAETGFCYDFTEL